MARAETIWGEIEKEDTALIFMLDKMGVRQRATTLLQVTVFALDTYSQHENVQKYVRYLIAAQIDAEVRIARQVETLVGLHRRLGHTTNPNRDAQKHILRRLVELFCKTGGKDAQSIVEFLVHEWHSGHDGVVFILDQLRERSAWLSCEQLEHLIQVAANYNYNNANPKPRLLEFLFSLWFQKQLRRRIEPTHKVPLDFIDKVVAAGK